MEGEIRTFKNGAKAVKLPNGRYRIISGPTKGPIGVKKNGRRVKKGGIGFKTPQEVLDRLEQERLERIQNGIKFDPIITRPDAIIRRPGPEIGPNTKFPVMNMDRLRNNVIDDRTRNIINKLARK